MRETNNSFNIFEHMGEEVKHISEKIDLISPDILIVYPARMTPAKKFDKVVTFAAAINAAADKSVKVVFCDFPSIDIHPDIYKALIKRLGTALGLSPDDIIFTTDCGYERGFPRNGVLELFELSNLFICPSFSESFGLTALEAASRGNFLVLNEKVPALEELGKELNAYFMRWDARNFESDTKEIYYPSEQEYLEEHAKKVVSLMMSNSVINAKMVTRQLNSPLAPLPIRS